MIFTYGQLSELKLFSTVLSLSLLIKRQLALKTIKALHPMVKLLLIFDYNFKNLTVSMSPFAEFITFRIILFAVTKTHPHLQQW